MRKDLSKQNWRLSTALSGVVRVGSNRRIITAVTAS